ncbi:ABC transporter ATP-binding protein [Solibacillus sp. FSL H8-0538]|uniref:ABC transporter ATP-binding protein n=1 Tax=Solibacillus sp. FSL H8-0538 TaxID=2921400 RepID=UPI0030F81741
MIHVQQVSKVYKNGRGLHSLDVTLHEGRITALVGANGAGKSTFIQLLTKQLFPSSGAIDWQDVNEIRYMPDDLQFPPTLTAQEILQMLGRLKGATQEEQDAVLEQVGLMDAKKLKIGHFSKGMRQRLNLAQSLLGNGKFFILDEPTNGLDPYWIARLKDMLIVEKARGTIIVFSTHLLSLAQELADEVVLIDQGRLLARGSVQQLLDENNCNHLEQLWLQFYKERTL